MTAPDETVPAHIENSELVITMVCVISLLFSAIGVMGLLTRFLSTEEATAMILLGCLVLPGFGAVGLMFLAGQTAIKRWIQS